MQDSVIVVAATTPIAVRVGHPTTSTGARMVVPLLRELGRCRGGAGLAAGRGLGMSAAVVLHGPGTR